ncbi:MAG: family 10 glycosylhydrolase, partial [Planctomycetes bacterium]|nr:family 10 glycosylhydrolase [Planctomycetota bacterium]
LERLVRDTRVEPAVASLDAGLALREQAADCRNQGKLAEAVHLYTASRRELVQAYLLAQPSPTREGRAVWNHSGTGAWPGDWERSAQVLAENGFNMVLPNLLWAGTAHYPSDILPRSGTFDRYGDQIRQCVDAAHGHGLQVHVWKVNWNLSGAPREFIARLRQAGRTQVSARGEPLDWLCPSHPENFQLELDSLLEVARKYEVDGLHFDYIRYPGGEYCYCDGCRERFTADLGRSIEDWPGECYQGALRDRYRDWRCQQITRLVEAVHREAKRIRPGLKISAAVFGAYPSCRESVGQDWPEWVRAGLLDFICPMDYTESDEKFCSLVENQLRLVRGRIPIYPGIGATASNSTLTPDRVVAQIHHARRLGADGFTIFNFSQSVAETIIPAVGLGATSRPAEP